jgi:hypothetical protein
LVAVSFSWEDYDAVCCTDCWLSVVDCGEQPAEITVSTAKQKTISGNPQNRRILQTILIYEIKNAPTQTARILERFIFS